MILKSEGRFRNVAASLGAGVLTFAYLIGAHRSILFSPAVAHFLFASSAAQHHVSVFSEIMGSAENGTFSAIARPITALFWASPPEIALATALLLVSLNVATLSWIVQLFTGRASAGCFAAVVYLATVHVGSGLATFGSADLLVECVSAEAFLLAVLVYAQADSNIFRRLLSVILLCSATAILPETALLSVPIAIVAFVLYGRLQALIDACLFVFVPIGVVLASGSPLHWDFVSVFKSLYHSLPLADRVTSAVIHDRISGNDRDIAYDHVPSVDWIGWATALVAFFATLLYLQRGREVRVGIGVALLGGATWLVASTFPEHAHFLAPLGISLLLSGALARILSSNELLRRLAPGAVAILMFLLIYGAERFDAASTLPVVQANVAFDFAKRAAAWGIFGTLPSGTSVKLGAGGVLLELLPSAADQERFLFGLARRSLPVAAAARWTFDVDVSPGLVPRATLAHTAASNQPLVESAHVFLQFANPPASAEYMTQLHSSSRGYAFHVMNGDATNLLLRLERLCGPVAMDQLLLPQAVPIEWGVGYYQIERVNPVAFSAARSIAIEYMYRKDPPWRYAAASSSLALGPVDCGPKASVASITLFAGYPGEATITAGSFKQVVRVSQAGTTVQIPVNLLRSRRSGISIVTTAPRVAQPYAVARYEDAPPRDIRLLIVVNGVTFTEAPTSP